MTKSERDQWTLILLPAIVTGMIYVWGYARGANNALAAAKAMRAKVQQDAPEIARLGAKQAALEKLEADLGQQKTKAASLLTTQTSLVGKYGNPEAQTVALSRVSSLFSRWNISLVTSSRVKESSYKAVDDFCKKQKLDAPEFWRIEAVGTYAEMANAVRELSQTSEALIPVSLEMQSVGGLADPADSDEQALQKWTLILWM